LRVLRLEVSHTFPDVRLPDYALGKCVEFRTAQDHSMREHGYPS
jgi:hypothetical protein